MLRCKNASDQRRLSTAGDQRRGKWEILVAEITRCTGGGIKLKTPAETIHRTEEILNDGVPATGTE